jgi:tetratricopeptide (TPR) repeat protein
MVTSHPRWKLFHNSDLEIEEMRYLIFCLAVLACLAQPSQPPDAGPLRDAEKALFAARYKTAAELYAEALKRDSAASNAYYGLVRALIEDHRSREAYAAAEEALKRSPQTVGTQTAAGLAAYRKGDLAKAEQHFLAARRMEAGYPGALLGLAYVHGAYSRFKTARNLRLAAYQRSPGDPELMIARAGTLKGAEHLAALQKALAILDPETEQARNLRAHIASDLAIGDRKLRVLASPYEASRIKLFRILAGPSHSWGVGVRVRLNQRQTAQLLLDTGASGIAVSPKLAARAGLERLGDQATDAKGIGDQDARASYRYLAQELRMGEVVFANYPVSVFRAAKSADFDGLIGADVFQRFVVTIDFPRLELALAPRPGGENSTDSEEPWDAGPPAAGFHRAVRFGNHLSVPTFVNNGPATLFLLDSGAAGNLIDTAVGRQSTKVRRDDRVIIAGVQGKVKETSRADDIKLVFAGFRQDNPYLVAISLEKTSDSLGVALGGILGMPVLSHMKLTIDYREGTVHLEYAK